MSEHQRPARKSRSIAAAIKLARDKRAEKIATLSVARVDYHNLRHVESDPRLQDLKWEVACDNTEIGNLEDAYFRCQRAMYAARNRAEQRKHRLARRERSHARLTAHHRPAQRGAARSTGSRARPTRSSASKPPSIGSDPEPDSRRRIAAIGGVA